MKKQKLRLEKLEVKSFVPCEAQVRGGWIRITVTGCRTLLCSLSGCLSYDIPCEV